MTNNLKEQVPYSRHTPQRTCIACRQTKAKRDLVRLVHTYNGNVEIDLKGKKTGRGAYLCPRQECWEAGLKRNRLERALRAHFAPENQQALLEYAKGLPHEEGGQQ